MKTFIKEERSMKTFIITGEFEFEIEAQTKEEAVEKVQDNLADLNNICHEVQEEKEK
tara:strand:- start:204 stop:374 length:171 start_codon:yes stop_codon:yes gene_type:complete